MKMKMKIITSSGELNLKDMTEQELVAIAKEAKEIYAAAYEELDRWETVRCYLCERENVAYRDTPFYGWTTSSGYVLCNICSGKYERKHGTKLFCEPSNSPVDEIMALLD